MAQHNSSGFGRGWIPMERDIGLPHDVDPFAPPPLKRRGLGGGGSPAETAFAATHHPNPSSEEEGLSLTFARPFTPDRRVRFLHFLATTGNVRRACMAVGVSPQAAYVHKRRDAAFAHGWDAALLLARDAAEEVLAERALNGVQETIFYRGEAVGSRVRFDARLLLAHLARLDRHHAETEAAGGIAARFDEYLAELLEAEQTGQEPAFAPPDDDIDAPPQWTPAQPTREEALLAAREGALYAFPPRVEDLPPELLADLNPADPHELWPQALAQSQHKAETAAAEAWDSETRTRLTTLDTLFEEDAAPSDPPHFGEVQMGQRHSGPPHFGEAQMGRWQPEGLTEGPIVASRSDDGGAIPPLETKSAKFPQDRVNRVNLRALIAAARPPLPVNPPSAAHRAGAVCR